MLRLPNSEARQACADHNIAVECVQLFPRYRLDTQTLLSPRPFRPPSLFLPNTAPCPSAGGTASCTAPCSTWYLLFSRKRRCATLQSRAAFCRHSPVIVSAPAFHALTLLQAITAAARQDMQDGTPHRLSYMAQVVKIVVELKKLAKEVSCAEMLLLGVLFRVPHAAIA